MPSSKLLSALDALDSDNSDIEILGPYPALITGKKVSAEIQSEKLHPIHPIFLSKAAPISDLTNIAPSFRNKRPAPIVHIQPPSVSSGAAHTHNAATRAKTSSTSDLPTYSYKDYTKPKPYLVFTRHESEADDLVAGLKSGPLALDLEWRFFYARQNHTSKVVEHRTALVQVADTAGLMLVIQVYNMARFPKALQTLIENPDIPKMGVNILNDGKKLFRDYGILPKNLVELGALAQVADPQGARGRKIVSLAKLVEQYANKILEKGKERTSDWEAELDQKQLEYAANDVHSTITVYNQLLTLAQQHHSPFTASTLTSCSSNVKMDISLLTSSGEPSSPLPSSAPPSRSSSSTSSSSSATSSISSPPSSEASQSSQSPGSQTPASSIPTRPQYLRAYQCWHHKGMTLDKMRTELSLKGKGTVEGSLGEGLKAGTVISYIIGALQADSTLPYEMKKLRELVQMDAGSWVRHREWILRVWVERRAVGEAVEW